LTFHTVTKQSSATCQNAEKKTQSIKSIISSLHKHSTEDMLNWPHPVL